MFILLQSGSAVAVKNLHLIGSVSNIEFCVYFAATRGTYCDGKLKEPVKPCAGNVGTQIVVRYKTHFLIISLATPFTNFSTSVVM